jgi:serine/threonine-protein kinase haspin
MLSNRDRRNGLVLTHTQQRSYGKYSKAPNKARYTLSDVVLDIGNKTHNFDISHDSFKFSDDEEDYAGAVSVAAQDDAMESFADEPYGGMQLISVAISDNESDNDNEVPVQSTPLKHKRKAVLQEIPSPSVMNTQKHSLTKAPALSRDDSNLKNRSSIQSTGSKRWSLLSFGDDKENKNTKRFSMTSVHSSSSRDTRSKRFSIASTSSSSSSFKHVVSKVGNVLSSVSISSGDASNESTPYKNIQPGIVGETESNKRLLSSSNAPAVSPMLPRKYSQASLAVSSVQSSYQNQRNQEYSKTVNSIDFSRVVSNTDQMSINTTSSIRSSKSRFRLSSLFSSKKDSDTESVRSIRGKSSFSDMRKNVLSMSHSKQSLFRLVKKDSLQDLKRKPSVDKMMISLPKPDTDSATKLKNKLRNSSSIISINSYVSMAPTITTTTTTLANLDDAQLKALLSLTGKSEVIDFQKFVSRLANADNQLLVKFAEASYSEVFVLKNYMTNENLKIFKIIPFGQDSDQPSVENVIQELKVNLKLNEMEGFIHLHNATVVEGCYPKLLMRLWDDYDEMKHSKNLRPEFEPNQQYLIMDLEYGGIDLENFKVLTWKQSLEIFWKVVKYLNQAEEKYKFEHRDLHWGNIVIDYHEKPLEDAFRDLSVIEEDIDDALSVKIIDYTLSRLEDDEIIFMRLDHQDFFKGKGDYQFDIYRYMRNELKSLQTSEEIDWSLSCFKNNLYWLHYLLDKLINEKGIKDNDGDSYSKMVSLFKTLNPKRKRLSDEGHFFDDFQSCRDVLRFGEQQGLY